MHDLQKILDEIKRRNGFLVWTVVADGNLAYARAFNGSSYEIEYDGRNNAESWTATHSDGFGDSDSIKPITYCPVVEVDPDFTKQVVLKWCMEKCEEHARNHVVQVLGIQDGEV